MKRLRERSQQFLLYFLPLLGIEVLFRILNQQHDQAILFFRSFLYVLFLSLILYFMNQHSHHGMVKFLTVFIFLFHAAYGFFQTGIKHYYGHFFSVRFLFHGTPDVGSYKIDFLLYIKAITYLFLVIGFIAVYFYLKKRSDKTPVVLGSEKIIQVVLVVAVYLAYLFSLNIGDPKNIFERSIQLYRKPYYTENALNQVGMSAFIPSDLRYAFFYTPNIEVEEVVEKKEEPEEKVNEKLEGRVFDDSEWIQIYENEENESLRAIDQYFLNKDYTEKNDYTGAYKGKNFIYVLVEAFDMIAIDEELTPTLYHLKTKGSYFNHFYSPQFNCATAESELMSLSSLYPVIDTCTMSAYYDRTTPQTIFKLFKEAGYDISSYHNWNDQFYPRSEIHPVLGSDEYLDVDELIPYLISGWQSDLTMMEGVVENLNQKEGPFMAYVITSSTHLPYDEDSALGNRYQEQVSSVYPNAPREIKTYLSKAIELDKAMAHLLENLEDIDNTVLMLFSDHRPLKMPGQHLEDFSPIPRLQQHELDRTPMIIYTPTQEPETITTVASTIDMAPTIANLFDLKHDTRLFMGADIYSHQENIVIFQNASWYNNKGYYNSNTAEFTAFDENKTLDDQDIQKINQEVKRKLNISSMIYTEDYFSHRKNIAKSLFKNEQ